MSDFMSSLKNTADLALPNESVTENGAIGYKTTGKALVDLNFMLSSVRNMKEDEIWGRFLPAYNENPALAIVWMFFARDILGGCGERRTFRVIFRRFCCENPDLAVKLLPLIPEYGRWDDVIEVFCGDVPCKVREEAFYVIWKQLDSDLDNARAGKPISLLTKWLPSLTTSSKETRRKAERLRVALGYTPRQYRKALSHLRMYLDVVERKMSAGVWSDIRYESVPSRAAMNYRGAFAHHDGERYNQYLENVRSGDAKIHSGTLFPYDIVHAYMNGDVWSYEATNPYDETLELQWKNLPNGVADNGSTLVVVDGSGSMCTLVGNTGVTCHDVARSLGIYFAERLTGPYHNAFITFSSRPQVIRFSDDLSLRSKLDLIRQYNDCSNTDIEAVFNLILDTAVSNHLKQDELPANILIVSDGEFDQMTYRGGWGWQGMGSGAVDAKLFDQIAERFSVRGYKLPRLVFWNVCSRTGTIPVKENELGVALVSGFSPNIADMVLSGELDPWKLLVDKLTSERYEPVRRIVMPS